MLVYPERINFLQELPKNKKLYFASDFHLGIPNKKKKSRKGKKNNSMARLYFKGCYHHLFIGRPL